MAFKVPKWDENNTNSVEPAAGLKTDGFEANDALPAATFNWLHRQNGINWARYSDRYLRDGASLETSSPPLLDLGAFTVHLAASGGFRIVQVRSGATVLSAKTSTLVSGLPQLKCAVITPAGYVVLADDDGKSWVWNLETDTTSSPAAAWLTGTLETVHSHVCPYTGFVYVAKESSSQCRLYRLDPAAATPAWVEVATIGLVGSNIAVNVTSNPAGVVLTARLDFLTGSHRIAFQPHVFGSPLSAWTATVSFGDAEDVTATALTWDENGSRWLAAVHDFQGSAATMVPRLFQSANLTAWTEVSIESLGLPIDYSSPPWDSPTDAGNAALIRSFGGVLLWFNGSAMLTSTDALNWTPLFFFDDYLAANRFVVESNYGGVATFRIHSYEDAASADAAISVRLP